MLEKTFQLKMAAFGLSFLLPSFAEAACYIEGASGRLANYCALDKIQSVLFLANTGVRHGTEALGLCWRNIEWYERDGERYLAVNVDGKTNKRTAIARDSVENSLWRQAQLNPRIQAEDFDGLIAAKLDEPVFATRLGETVTVHNLNRAFNALLDALDLKTGADGRTRTLYSFRHFYATLNLERGVTTHALSRQLGNSTEMIDRHYSKYSPLLNAEVHSGRKR